MADAQTPRDTALAVLKALKANKTGDSPRYQFTGAASTDFPGTAELLPAKPVKWRRR